MSDDEPLEPDVDHHYWKLHQYVRMVCNGESNALLVEASHGLGKSFQIVEILSDEIGFSTGNVRKVGGYATPVEVYHTLYDCRDSGVVFFDDLEGIISNKKCVSLLKQATWSESDTRRVEWRSTSEKIEAPETFEFNGRLIFCFNETTDNSVVDSLKNRTLYYRLRFSYGERIDLIQEVAKAEHKDLSYEERKECADWIEEHSHPGVDVNLRTLMHTMDCRSFEPDRWKELASEFVDVDEEQVLVKRLLDEHDKVGDAAKAYAEETGKTERSFYNRKREIVSDQ